MNYKFSGHETFHCRPIWLKKGYDYASNGKRFKEENSVIELGVGKNMVSSIKFWLRAFGFYNLYTNQLEGLSKDIFDDNEGFDKFLEDDATLYLLHYLLIKHVEISSIYYLAFMKLSKEKLEFSTENLVTFIERECLKEKVDFNDKTLRNDIKVFIKNYVPSDDSKGSIEDNFSGLFYNLRFINKVDSTGNFRFNINDGKYLPEAIFFYVILDKFENEVSISIEAIRDEVSTVFLMEKQGTYSMIERIVQEFPDYVTFKDDGGRQELQFKKEISKKEILSMNYGRF